jgi:hypothetical protein
MYNDRNLRDKRLTPKTPLDSGQNVELHEDVTVVRYATCFIIAKRTKHNNVQTVPHKNSNNTASKSNHLLRRR